MPFTPESFEASYAMNSLLHVPNALLPEVLEELRKVLVSGGLFLLGVYEEEPFEGDAPEDSYEPPRFFSFRSDDQMVAFVEPMFQVLDFHDVEPEGVHFQSLTLRKR
ncbi:MAG: class I SAM-dependent methyltransferase [Actinomycetota bacterium]